MKFYQRRFRDRSLALKVAVAGGITSILTILLPHALLTSKDLQDFAIVGQIDSILPLMLGSVVAYLVYQT